MADKTDGAPVAPFGTIIRAANGDILRFDSTGMVLVLSDTVIDDIARRLPVSAAPAGLASSWIDPTILGNVDAWDVRRDGEWLLFNANLDGQQGPRLFRRLAEAPDADSQPGIFADGAGPLYGMLSLGGARRADGLPEPLSFPWHVLAPADDIGAVGLAGTEEAVEQDALQRLPELTRDAAIADVIVARQHKNHEALTLFMARTETDTSASITDLARGVAYANFLTAIGSLKAAAARMERQAVLYSIGLAFTLEDVVSDADTYCKEMLVLIGKLTTEVARMGLHCPPFLAQFDCGTHDLSDHPVLRAQWDLAWQGASHGLCFTAPGYMFRQDRFGRPDIEALWQMAEMDACALEVLRSGEEWSCPIFLLAEREPDPAQIRVKARALSGLVIDGDDPFGAGPSLGFSLAGADNAPELVSVAVAEDDPQDVILTFDKVPEGATLELRYGIGTLLDRAKLDYPSACGALRDEWTHDSNTGATLHRWALPAALPVW
ncbi:MAG: hypothetical protein ABJ263_04495 [Tateyamaria sp.]|uniref:hypothetical protein n=1 Tax=Tateyamaria sp. TaxID=1929288 RepID=UPI00328BA704